MKVEITPEGKVRMRDIYAWYREMCRERGQQPMSQRAYNDGFLNAGWGIEKWRSNGEWWLTGIRLVDGSPTPPPIDNDMRFFLPHAVGFAMG